MARFNKVKPIDDNIYKFIISKCQNNAKLIRRVLQEREHWEELDEMYISTHYNFKWTGSSKNFNFDQLRAENAGGEKKMINHLERHYLLSAKDKLYLNMRRYCEKQKLNVFNYLPLQYVLDL